MRRAVVICFLTLGVLSEVTTADEPQIYRGQTAAKWLQQLSHPSASARAAAAQAFVKIGKGNENAVEPLIGRLSDRDERVRFYAAFALGKIEVRHEQCIAALIKALPDKDEHVRYTAQWSLAQIAKQVAASDDLVLPDDRSLADLFAKAETSLLVSGGLPGHLNQVRSAIARFETPIPEVIAVEPSIAAETDQEDEINNFLKGIGSEDIHARVKAIDDLSELGSEAVQRLLDSPDIAQNLGPIGRLVERAIANQGESVIPILVAAMQSPREEVNYLAADALIELGPLAIDALPALIELLENENSSDAAIEQAIRVIVQLGPSAGAATDLLVRILNDDDQYGSMREVAARALGSIGADAKSAIPALTTQLANPDIALFVRAECAAALARIDPDSEEVTRALVAAFHNTGDPFDAISIAEHLCDCGSGAAAIVPRLLSMIGETSFDERRSIVELLGKLGGASAEEVCPLLVELLMDSTEDIAVRVASAKALGNLGPEGVKLIVDEFELGDEANQLTAARALVEIGAAALPALQELREMLQDSNADRELRSLAAVVLGQLGEDAVDAVPSLTELLEDEEADAYLRAMCAVAIGQIDPSSIPILEAAFDDSEAEVQIAAAYAVCKRDAAHESGLAKLVHWLASDEYRGLAINAIIDVGEASLSRVVEMMNDTSQSRDTRFSCLEVVSAFDERAIAPLLEALNDETLAEDAGWALRDRGNDLLPRLVSSFEDEARFTSQARTVIGSVIEDMFTGLGAGGNMDSWEGGHPLVHRDQFEWEEMSAAGGAMMEAPYIESIEPMLTESEPVENLAPVEEDEAGEPEAEVAESPSVPDGYISVDVHYGTNRQPIDQDTAAAAGRRGWFWLAALGALLLVVAYLIGMYRRGARRQATAGLAGTTLLLLVGLLLFAPTTVRPAIEKTGPQYGGDYSDQVEMGVCEVTIPDSHQEGELEAPTWLRLQVAEDLQKHIVLRSVRRMESDAFFGSLRKEMQRKGNHLLVFIHGYNVSFEDAARRTAQMSSDLKFAGAPVFYSWPSKADWMKYRVDEKNVELSVDQLKAFLLAIAERSEADTINLVAHSMGNRVLTNALKEIDVAVTEREQLFNQVILAAPDIDADIFKQRIAPAIVTKAKHITLYASSKDLALVASRTFNSGDPRAGDAGQSLVVVPGIETIDVSSGDSSLIGHSYYGDNISVLRDIEFLLRDEPASSRRFLEPMAHEGELRYWTFQPPTVARRSARSLPAR